MSEIERSCPGTRDALAVAHDFIATMTGFCEQVTAAAREGAAAIADLAEQLRRVGPGPTRRQKKCWRRRVSRARYSDNDRRSVGYDVDTGLTYIIAGWDWSIVAPWERRGH